MVSHWLLSHRDITSKQKFHQKRRMNQHVQEETHDCITLVHFYTNNSPQQLLFPTTMLILKMPLAIITMNDCHIVPLTLRLMLTNGQSEAGTRVLCRQFLPGWHNIQEPWSHAHTACHWHQLVSWPTVGSGDTSTPVTHVHHWPVYGWMVNTVHSHNWTCMTDTTEHRHKKDIIKSTWF